MKEEQYAVVFAVMLLSVLFFVPTTGRSSVSVSSVNIEIPGEEPVFSGDDPVIVRGVIHNISFPLPSVTDDMVLELQYGASGKSSEENDTIFYRWSFNQTTGRWTDDLYGRYIIPAACGIYDGNLSFHVGLSTSAYLGVWNLSLYEGAALIYSSRVAVQDYTVGLALQSVNTVFTISPFSSESKTSEYHIRVENKGNIPLKISVLFGDFQALFSVTNITEPLHVGEKRDLYITLNSIPWSPRTVNITGVVHPAVPNYLVSEGSVSFATTADQTFNLRIEVVRQGYTLVRLGNIMIQYKDTVAANYGASLAIDVYLSSINSSGTADLHISADLLSIDSVVVDNETSSEDVALTLSNRTERHVRLLVTPIEPSTTAYVSYDIRDRESSERDVLRTEVVVGAPVPVERSDTAVLVALASIVVLFIISIIFITLIHFRRGRHGREERPSSRSVRRRRTKEE